MVDIILHDNAMKTIAQQLKISIKTVKLYRKNAYAKQDTLVRSEDEGPHNIVRIANSPLYGQRRQSDNLSQAVMLLGLNATLTNLMISAGVATHDEQTPFADAGALLSAADQAMYSAKLQGRDRLIRWQPPAH